jgi:hypothetical protein
MLIVGVPPEQDVNVLGFPLSFSQRERVWPGRVSSDAPLDSPDGPVGELDNSFAVVLGQCEDVRIGKILTSAAGL